MCSLVPHVKHYNVDMDYDDNYLTITYQRCNGCVTCSSRSGELLYINFIHAVMFNLVLCSERIVIESFYYWLRARNKIQIIYQKFLKKVMVIYIN